MQDPCNNMVATCYNTTTTRSHFVFFILCSSWLMIQINHQRCQIVILKSRVTYCCPFQFQRSVLRNLPKGTCQYNGTKFLIAHSTQFVLDERRTMILILRYTPLFRNSRPMLRILKLKKSLELHSWLFDT